MKEKLFLASILAAGGAAAWKAKYGKLWGESRVAAEGGISIRIPNHMEVQNLPISLHGAAPT